MTIKIILIKLLKKINEIKGLIQTINILFLIKYKKI